jgi:RNA polymerase sigma factor (sigma-70 family)
MRTAQTGVAGEPGIGDVGELYELLSARLERIVRRGIQAPDAVIEDACQFAWSRLVHHKDRVHSETALGWLVKTAVHEAFKLVRRAARDLSLELAIEQGGEVVSLASRLGPSELCEQRERLGAIASLPAQQQRAVWLHAAGFSYAEIASRDGCTTRTVERQLGTARRELRFAAAG